MRVITGSAKGRRLKTLEGLDIRPTTERVKEGLFSIIQFYLPEATVLDLFAGSGQLGIEALSRGAKSCVFVDQSAKAVSVVRENLQKTQLEDKAKLVNREYTAYLKNSTEVFHVVLLDPPYNQNLLPGVLDSLQGKVMPNGIVVCEHEQQEKVPEQMGLFVLNRQYRYGKVILSKYCINEGI